MNMPTIVRQPAWTRYLLAKLTAENEAEKASEQALAELIQRLRGTPSQYHAA